MLYKISKPEHVWVRSHCSSIIKNHCLVARAAKAAGESTLILLVALFSTNKWKYNGSRDMMFMNRVNTNNGQFRYMTSQT